MPFALYTVRLFEVERPQEVCADNDTGFFSGALIPLPPSIFPVVCPDPKVLGARLGMAQAVGATASLIGAPIAGALIRNNGQDYLGLQLFGGLVMLTGTIFQVCLWVNLVTKRNCKKSI